MSTVETPQLTEEEELQKKILDYKMPVPNVGQAILWYPTGRQDGNPARIAHVTKINSRSGRSIQVMPIGQRENFSAVRHIDDPKLDVSEDLRAEGAWDFTPEHYTILSLRKDVDELLKNQAKPSSAKRGPGRPPKSQTE